MSTTINVAVASAAVLRQALLNAGANRLGLRQRQLNERAANTATLLRRQAMEQQGIQMQ